ncbi:MAG: PaaI family thioesterase [Actinobacteria bacterium]|nr:PaaI family thioesterase [Actinomycetota bacterium]
MPAGTEWYPDAATFTTPGRLQLAASTRRLVDALLTLPAEDAQLELIAQQLDAMLAALHERATTRGAGTPPRRERANHGDFLPRSPLVGEVNAVAPPFDWELVDETLRSTGRFTACHEGPPGYVHGGWVALAFDEALGITNVATGHPGMTARLTIRYRKPTPLGVDLVIESHIDKIEGRRVQTVGRMLHGETVTAEAEGVFVNIGAERALEYFGERTGEPVDPLP